MSDIGDQWVCAECETLNAGGSGSCVVCDRPRDRRTAPAETRNADVLYAAPGVAEGVRETMGATSQPTGRLCGTCQSRFDAHLAFCPQCGTPVPGSETLAVAASKVATPAGPSGPPRSRGRLAATVAGVFALGLLIGGGLFAFLARSNSTTTTTADSPVPRQTTSTVSTASTSTMPASSASSSSTSSPPTSTSSTRATIGSPTTLAPSTTTPVAPVDGPDGDLGIAGEPITKPACDGRFITLVGAAVDPTRYATDVRSLLDRYRGSHYLRSEGLCASLRGRNDSGDLIYAVYFGPFSSLSQACASRSDGPSGAYVKALDNSSDPSVNVPC